MLVLGIGLLEQPFMVSIKQAIDNLCRTKNIYVVVAVMFVDSVYSFNENLYIFRSSFLKFPNQPFLRNVPERALLFSSGTDILFQCFTLQEGEEKHHI